jgi:hypothetical protein
MKGILVYLGEDGIIGLPIYQMNVMLSHSRMKPKVLSTVYKLEADDCRC